MPVRLRNHSYSISAALGLYQPPPYEGRVAHFLARDRQSGSVSQLEEEWRFVTSGPVTFHEIDSAHSTIWEPPNVFSMARILASELHEGGGIVARTTAA